MRVTIVGAGIVGASIAYHLAKRGAQVTVLDAERPCGGTSGATFAWLNAFRKLPESYYQLNAKGVEEYQSITQELRCQELTHFDGGLFWARSDDEQQELERHAARLQDWGYPCHFLSKRAARKLEPDLRFPDSTEAILRTPEEGWVEVAPLVGRLLAAAIEYGAQVHFPARVVDIDTSGEQATVLTASGERFDADVLVTASGPASAELLAAVGVSLPLEQRPGLLAISRPSVVSLKHVIHAPDVHFRPDSGGRIIAGHADHDQHLVAPGAERLAVSAEELMGYVARWLPAFRGTPPETYRIGVRPIPGDGLPVVGWASTSLPVYIVVTHSAVTLGPLLGRLASQEVLEGASASELDHYRIARFEVQDTTIGNSP